MNETKPHLKNRGYKTRYFKTNNIASAGSIHETQGLRHAFV